MTPLSRLVDGDATLQTKDNSNQVAFAFGNDHYFIVHIIHCFSLSIKSSLSRQSITPKIWKDCGCEYPLLSKDSIEQYQRYLAAT